MFINTLTSLPEKRKKKGLKFDIIKEDMNTALEFINSPSSAAGPERWLEQKPSTRSVPIYNHSQESSPEMSNWHAQLKCNTSHSVLILWFYDDISVYIYFTKLDS